MRSRFWVRILWYLSSLIGRTVNPLLYRWRCGLFTAMLLSLAPLGQSEDQVWVLVEWALAHEWFGGFGCQARHHMWISLWQGRGRGPRTWFVLEPHCVLNDSFRLSSTAVNHLHTPGSRFILGLYLHSPCGSSCQKHRADFGLFAGRSWRRIKEQMALRLSFSLPGKTSGLWQMILQERGAFGGSAKPYRRSSP